MIKVFIGYDREEHAAARVAARSLHERTTGPVDSQLLSLPALRHMGLYTRTAWVNEAQHFDTIDGRPFSTEFSFTRFLVPALMQWQGWALFCDSDVMFRGDVAKLFRAYTTDSSKALLCVKHRYAPTSGVKMRGNLVQATYPRKNWSSVMLFNCAHPANWLLTPQLVNTSAGRDLQQLFWLRDNEIGDLPEAWNWLEGHSSTDLDPKLVHFTRGTPDVPSYGDVPFANEWWAHYGAEEDAA